MTTATPISQAVEIVAAKRGITATEAWETIKADIWRGDLPADGRDGKGNRVHFDRRWINYLARFHASDQQPRPVFCDPGDQLPAHVSREEIHRLTDFPDGDWVWFDSKAAALERELRKAGGEDPGPPVPPISLHDCAVDSRKLASLYRDQPDHPAEAAPKTAVPGPPELKLADDDRIHRAISAVYDEIEEAGGKPPNVKEIAAPMQARLRGEGYKASGRQIEHLAGEERHKKRRRAIGNTVASEKRRLRK
jgi:hypothetical protein